MRQHHPIGKTINRLMPESAEEINLPGENALEKKVVFRGTTQLPHMATIPPRKTRVLRSTPNTDAGKKADKQGSRSTLMGP